MTSLDDIVLVSEADFASTYVSRRHLEAAVNELSSHGITFPITYASPFFRQLSWLSMLVYFKGSLSILEKEVNGSSYTPNYAVHLFVTEKLGHGRVEGKLHPYFSVSPKTNLVAVGLRDSDKPSRLNRPLARILHCLEVPTNDEHFISAQLPNFMTELAATLPKLEDKSSTLIAYRLLLDMCEAFFSVKTTFNQHFYWEFFLPIKKDKPTAQRFRNNLVRFFQQVLPGVGFTKLGEPRSRIGGPSCSPVQYYDSFLSLSNANVKALISLYGGVLDLGGLLAGQPRVLEFYRAERKRSLALANLALTNGNFPNP